MCATHKHQLAPLALQNKREIYSLRFRASVETLPRGATATVPALPFVGEKSNLKITSVRLVHTMPKGPLPAYKPSATAWSTKSVEIADPMSIYPEYKVMRSLFLPDPGKLPWRPRFEILDRSRIMREKCWQERRVTICPRSQL